MPIQPSPSRPARRNAGSDSPPMKIGMGRWTGLGSKATSAKGKCGPSCATVSSVHNRRHTPMASSSRAPLVAGSTPSASHSACSQPAPAPITGAPARNPVQGAEGAGGDEGMAQAEQVDVRAEAERRGPGGHEGEHGRGVEQLRRRGHGRVLGTGIRGSGHGEGQHQVLGQPGRLETRVGRPPRRPRARCGGACARRSRRTSRGPPGTAAKLPGRPAPHMARPPCAKNAGWTRSRTRRCPSTGCPATRSCAGCWP